MGDERPGLVRDLAPGVTCFHLLVLLLPCFTCIGGEMLSDLVFSLWSVMLYFSCRC